MLPTLIILFLVGAAIGSFLNVCIYRLPRRESVIAPASHCPACEQPLKWYDNIPLLSYALLKGKCRRCKGAIPIRYPLVELLNASLYVLAGLKFDAAWPLLPALLLISALIVIFFIDLEHYIIPNVVVLPVAAAGLAANIAIEPERWLELLLTGVLSAAFFLAIVLIKPGGMGMGDVKLAGMLGFFLGWPSVLVGVFTAFLTGALAGVALMIAGRKDRKSRIPFGPFLAIGAIIALFFGQQLLDWYTGIFSGQ